MISLDELQNEQLTNQSSLIQNPPFKRKTIRAFSNVSNLMPLGNIQFRKSIIQQELLKPIKN